MIRATTTKQWSRWISWEGQGDSHDEGFFGENVNFCLYIFLFNKHKKEHRYTQSFIIHISRTECSTLLGQHQSTQCCRAPATRESLIVTDEAAPW